MSIENLSDNSVLALAAYADTLIPGSIFSDENQSGLLLAGLTDDQIARFEQQWPEIVDVANSFPTGLGATIFSAIR